MNLNNLTSFIPENGNTQASAPTGGGKNHLSAEVEIKGTLRFENELLFDGKIEGEILSAAGTLVVGKNATVKGEINTKSVTIFGTIEGNVTVSERCELKSSSQLNGDLKAQRMTIEDGAVFVGNSDVNANRAGGRPAAKEAAKPVAADKNPAKQADLMP